VGVQARQGELVSACWVLLWMLDLLLILIHMLLRILQECLMHIACVYPADIITRHAVCWHLSICSLLPQLGPRRQGRMCLQ
jgi:hypothetical protein